MSDKGNIAELSAALQPYGMLMRGGFALTEEDERLLAGFADLASTTRGRTLVLIGNAGAPLYEAFFAAGDAEGRNPLDDWTKRIVRPIAERYGARAAFPSDGPPWLPFQRWAMRAEGVKPSPLGVLIHPEFGLWHAYRAALVFDQVLDLQPVPFRAHPCDASVEKPCLSACPVGAVTSRATLWITAQAMSPARRGGPVDQSVASPVAPVRSVRIASIQIPRWRFIWRHFCAAGAPQFHTGRIRRVSINTMIC